MPLSQIEATTKAELISKITKLEIEHGKSKEQALAIAFAEAERRGFKDISPLSSYQEFTGHFDKIKEENGYLVIPVTMAAEMIQYYHISEVPWLREYTDQEVITVFKDGEELKKAIAEYKSRDKDLLLPIVHPHTDGIFCEKQAPLDIKDKMHSFVKREEMKGYAKDLHFDEKTRTQKATVFVNISKNDPILIQRLRDGKIVEVSIGFTCNWTSGGVYKDKEYMLKQTDIRLGHLAMITDGHGKCSFDKCGLNKDQSIIETPITHIHLMDEACMKKEEAEEEESDPDHKKKKKTTSSTDAPKSVQQDGFIKALKSNNHNSEVKSSMPTIEELQAIIAAKDKEIATFKDAELSKEVTALKDQLHSKDVIIGTLNQSIIAKDNDIKDLQGKIETAAKDAIERHDIVMKLDGLKISKIGDQNVKDMSIKDLKLTIATLDVALAQNGVVQGSQAAHDAQLKVDKTPKVIGTVGVKAADLNNMKRESFEK
jgi:hypothetical protein